MKAVAARWLVERKKENGQPKGGMGGRHAATTQGFQGEGCGALAVAYPWALGALGVQLATAHPGPGG